MENGTLAQWRKKAIPSVAVIEQLVGFCSFLRLWKVMTLCKILEVAHGIAYIHSEGIVHGDLRGVFHQKHNMS
jgi:serine/threonine protein kinase